jgi:hypothetical protein
LVGFRIVADAAAVDDGRWDGPDVHAIRLAPDEVFVLGANGGVRVFDAAAMYDVESGFVGAWLPDRVLAEIVRRLEWPLPAHRPALAQGKVAGVPAKLWLTDDGRTLLLTHAAYAHELEERLGWR